MPTITVSGADFSNSRDYDLPFSGIQHLNFYRGGAANADRNLGEFAGTPVVAGAPVYGAGFSNFGSLTDFIETGVPDSQRLTLFAAARSLDTNADSATQPTFVGNHNGATDADGGAMLYVDAANRIRGLVRIAGAQVQPLLNADPNVWAFYALRITDTEVRLQDLTRNLSTSQPLATPHLLGRAHRVGANRTFGFRGRAAIAAAGIVNRAMSDAELAAIYARVKLVAAVDGIAI